MLHTLQPRAILKRGISYTATGATQIGTTENGTERFVPVSAIIRIATANTLTIAGSISIGVNGASYSDVSAITLLSGLTSVNKTLKLDLISAANSDIPANTSIFVNVTTAATATSGTFDIILIGYYL